MFVFNFSPLHSPDSEDDMQRPILQETPQEGGVFMAQKLKGEELERKHVHTPATPYSL